MAPVAGRNGVVIVKRPPRGDAPAYRTYEVHQRERVGESTGKIKPVELISDDYRRDPYPLVAILRENYPCYRDWLANSYWITRYNDVTSVFTDDASFETRPKSWLHPGRQPADELPLLAAEERITDDYAGVLAGKLAKRLAETSTGDLASGFAAPFATALTARIYGIPEADLGDFARRYWRLQRGASWNPGLQRDGRVAARELVDYFNGLLAVRVRQPGDDAVSALLQSGPVTGGDLVATLLARDHETLHGALANLWFLLLTHPDEFAKAGSEPRLMKLAYLETLRHSTPVIAAQRFARREVERFGRLLPEGARLICSAAAANRDPRIFRDPEKFIVDRKDLCQREPRGQYRADGLASGIAFGTGKPSVHPALPEDRPRSRYAITRDAAVTASRVLLEHLDNLKLARGASPELTSLTVGEMHTCWKLPVSYGKR